MLILPSSSKQKNMSDDLLWLTSWFYKQKGKEKEHENEIKIGTIDNPGWYFEINLTNTGLREATFQEIDINRSEHDWLYCSIKDRLFQGFGGPLNLPDLIKNFRVWAESNTSEQRDTTTIDVNLMWLLKWYESQCDGDWEHGNGVEITTTDNKGWRLRITLEDTELQNKPFQKIISERSEHDWINCFVKDRIFEGLTGPFNLAEAFRIFRNWAEN
jgi:hypothetical protein